MKRQRQFVLFGATFVGHMPHAALAGKLPRAAQEHCSANKMKTITIAAIPVVIIVSLIAFVVLPRTEYSRVSDPTGKYTAICTYRTYLSHLPMSTGSSTDKPCFVRIVDSKDEDYGELPVEMIQLVGIEWLTDGAEIPAVGEWDFAQRTCRLVR